jgi:hypothetical protein
MSSKSFSIDYAAMAQTLEASGDYRVLRKLQPPTRYERDSHEGSSPPSDAAQPDWFMS